MKKRNILIGVISVLLVLSSVAGATIDYSKYYNRYFVETDLLRSKITSDGVKKAKLDNSIYLTMEIVNGWTKGHSIKKESSIKQLKLRMFNMQSHIDLEILKNSLILSSHP